MKNLIGFVIILLLIFSISGSLIAGNGIGLNIRVPINPYAPSTLGDKLDLYLSSFNGMPVTRNEIIMTSTDENDKVISFEELLSFGMEQNRSFLVDINFDRVDLEVRKSSVLPHLISRYRVYAVITGWMRIVDIENRKLVKLKKIAYEIKAKDRWQFTDDDIHDADLHIPADKKHDLFERLDEETAEKIYLEIKKLTKGK